MIKEKFTKLDIRNTEKLKSNSTSTGGFFHYFFSSIRFGIIYNISFLPLKILMEYQGIIFEQVCIWKYFYLRNIVQCWSSKDLQLQSDMSKTFNNVFSSSFWFEYKKPFVNKNRGFFLKKIFTKESDRLSFKSDSRLVPNKNIIYNSIQDTFMII